MDRDRNKGKGEQNPVREMLKNKIQEKQGISKEFDIYKKTFEEKKRSLDDLYNRSQDIRRKMKKLGSKEQIAKDLQELKDQQKSGKISISEEKAIVK